MWWRLMQPHRGQVWPGRSVAMTVFHIHCLSPRSAKRIPFNRWDGYAALARVGWKTFISLVDRNTVWPT